MQQHELRPPRGAKRARKRVGRGNASGHGTYAGKGIKGQQARSGPGPRPGFEGGQTPLIRRLPARRGFSNPFRVAFVPINLRDLGRFPAGSEVTPEALRDSGLVRTLRRPIKILGEGEVSAALTVRVHRVSASARSKIEAAGGTVEELLAPKPPRKRKGAPAAQERAAAAQQEPEEAEPVEEPTEAPSEEDEAEEEA